jgi:hypothetical protein
MASTEARRPQEWLEQVGSIWRRGVLVVVEDRREIYYTLAELPISFLCFVCLNHLYINLEEGVEVLK